MFKTHERKARIRIKRREINANKTITATMKKTYIQPTSTVITMSDNLCDNGLTIASVKLGETDKTIDNIKVVEENESSSMDWGSGTWGGD